MTLKEARIKANLSAEETAKRLGFPLKTWMAWENEERTPPKIYWATYIRTTRNTDNLIHQRCFLIF